MCTAVTFHPGDFYMGRTLDYERSFGDRITVIPRNFPLKFHALPELSHHHAIVGMAAVMEDYPLYYEGFNEKGLGVCGLNFVENCAYFPEKADKSNLCQYELIPYLLGKFETVQEVRAFLENANLLNIPFRAYLPLAQLHWMIADKDSCITVESMADGLHIYDNPVGAMTNNPPFPYQLFALNNYRHLGIDTPENTFGTELNAYSRGLGGLGLPGDLSSQSRFVRVVFTKLHSLCEAGEMPAVSQFFHILGSVDQQRGLCRLKENEYEITLYTCCCNLSRGIYYYTTYDNHQITAVDMHRENLEGDKLICYQPVTGEQVRFQN